MNNNKNKLYNYNRANKLIKACYLSYIIALYVFGIILILWYYNNCDILYEIVCIEYMKISNLYNFAVTKYWSVIINALIQI